jgi:2-dehydro-3-deoxyphosphogluconate aldolase/(4S)-4-hydroxy-2-oxoglutarate aldolase
MLKDILNLGPVMPVIVIDNAGDAVPLADALLAGGIKAIEITLRTDAALDAMHEISAARPDMVVGAGTILNVGNARDAKAAGAKFAVSPGATDRVLSGCEEAELPLLPGAATVSEMMGLAEKGYETLKFFPASAAGGMPLLKSLISPLPHLTFCPTGGITQQTAPDWLALQNIACVGGSWIAPQKLISDGAFDEITKRAAAAQSLKEIG